MLPGSTKTRQMRRPDDNTKHSNIHIRMKKIVFFWFIWCVSWAWLMHQFRQLLATTQTRSGAAPPVVVCYTQHPIFFSGFGCIWESLSIWLGTHLGHFFGAEFRGSPSEVLFQPNKQTQTNKQTNSNGGRGRRSSANPLSDPWARGGPTCRWVRHGPPRHSRVEEFECPPTL